MDALLPAWLKYVLALKSVFGRYADGYAQAARRPDYPLRTP
jgi:hypothetical protein